MSLIYACCPDVTGTKALFDSQHVLKTKSAFLDALENRAEATASHPGTHMVLT